MKTLFLILLTSLTFAQSPFWRMELMENATASSTPDITTGLVALWQDGDTVDVAGRRNDLTRSHTDPTPSPDAYNEESTYDVPTLCTYGGIVWRALTGPFSGITPSEGENWTHHQPYKTATGLAGIDSAITFNGIDHYLSMASTTDLQLGGTDFTIAMWVKLNRSGYGETFFGKGDEYLLVCDDGRTVGGFGFGNSGINNPPAYTFIIITFSAQYTNLYIDGLYAEVGEWEIINGNDVFSIGLDLNGNGQNSGIDVAQLAIYKRALTAEQITYLYNGGDGRLIVP